MIPRKKRKIVFLSIAVVAVLIAVPSSYMLYSNSETNFTITYHTAVANFTGDFTNVTSTASPIFLSNVSSKTTIYQHGYPNSTLGLLMNGHGYHDLNGNNAGNLTYGYNVVYLNIAVSGVLYGSLKPSDLTVTFSLSNNSSNSTVPSYYAPGSDSVNLTSNPQGPNLGGILNSQPINVSFAFLNDSTHSNDSHLPYYYFTTGYIYLQFGLTKWTPYHFVVRVQFSGPYSDVNSTIFLNLENT